MKISVILAHPDKNSFNHAIAEIVNMTLKENKHEVYFHDLYKEEFSPLLLKYEIPINGIVPDTIMNYCNELLISNGIIIIHPNWWGQPPAILKGWIDRIIRPGIAYKFVEGDKGDGIPIGLLKADTAIVFNTANTPDEREKNVFYDPLEKLRNNCIFNLLNIFRKTYILNLEFI